jgi:hypothetical protein
MDLNGIAVIENGRVNQGVTWETISIIELAGSEITGVATTAFPFAFRVVTYRVFSGSKSGAGVQVDDAKGKKLSTLDCAESPAIFPEYLRQSLPCDPQNPHGAAACRKDPYPGK